MIDEYNKHYSYRITIEDGKYIITRWYYSLKHNRSVRDMTAPEVKVTNKEFLISDIPALFELYS